MIEYLYSYVGVYVEGLTMFGAFLGMIVSLKHSLYYGKIKRTIKKPERVAFAEKMERNFFWDFGLYTVTFFISMGLLFDLLWLLRIDMVARVFVIFTAVYASDRLFRHYKIIHDKDNN